MLVLLIVAVVALVLAFLFVVIVVGARQEHPTHLAIQGPTVLAALARRVLGLYVRRADLPPRAGPAIDADQPGALTKIDAW